MVVGESRPASSPSAVAVAIIGNRIFARTVPLEQNAGGTRQDIRDAALENNRVAFRQRSCRGEPGGGRIAGTMFPSHLAIRPAVVIPPLRVVYEIPGRMKVRRTGEEKDEPEGRNSHE